MKKITSLIAILVTASFLVSCGKSPDSKTQSPDPATQPEAQAELFNRSSARVKALIEAKDFGAAQRALDGLKSYKLTEEQQKIVTQLQAQIPKS